MDYIRDERRRRDSRGRFMRDRGYEGRGYEQDRRRGGDRGYGMDERRGRDRGYEMDDRRGRMNDRGYGRDYGYDRNYGREMRRDRGMTIEYEKDDRPYDDYDSHEDMEYNDMYLSERELHDWAKMLENADGSKGAKFGKEQIVSIARAQGVQFHDFTEEELVMTANMLYSDYCKVMPTQDAAVYVRMAKAFLEDPDAVVKGGEKLAKYYDDFVR